MIRVLVLSSQLYKWHEFHQGVEGRVWKRFFLFENWLFGVEEKFVSVLKQPSLLWTISAEIDLPDFAV